MNDLTHTISRSRTPTDTVARGLGWFSIGLGMFEIFAPQRITGGLGMNGRERLIRLYGARELMTGIGLLSATPRAAWMWARVLGDALDVGTLVTHWRQGALPRRNTAFAIGAVAGIAAADIATATSLTASERRPQVTRDYSDRSGFPRPPEQMRGLGRKEPTSPTASLADAATPWAITK